MLRFDHIGLATRSLVRAQAALRELGFAFSDPPFVDSVQGVRGCFGSCSSEGLRVELLENLPDSRVLDPWLSGGAGYQLAFWADSWEEELLRLAQAGWRPIRGPDPASAFGGRWIAFFMHPGFPNLILELIHAGDDAAHRTGTP
jgi:hypothetical protein|nr:MAG: hypothetical protein KatS3mg041_2004 [Bacteroidota bacterium]